MELTLGHFIALLPILVIGTFTVLVMLSVAWRRNQTITATLTAIGLNLALLSIWPATKAMPTGITPLFEVDFYACFYMGMILLVTLACTSLAHVYLEKYPGNKDEFYILLLLAATGGMVLVCSRHMAGLFIGLELLSLPVYGLVGYAFFQRNSLEAGIKYMVLSAAGSAFLLFGMALVYANSGSLAFADIAKFLTSTENHLTDLGLVMMLVGLAFKLSLVPFHLWTPDVYEGAPAPASAFLSTVSKVAVFAMLLRMMNYIGPHVTEWLPVAMTIIAIASIVIGNLLALFQNNIKRLLAYSSIAHFGYLLTILIAETGPVISNGVTSNENNAFSLTVETAGVYLFTYVITVLGAFSVISLMSKPYGEGRDADALYNYRGMFWRRPMLTVAFSVMILSLAGIPLTGGFIGKFFVIAAGVHHQLWWMVGAVVLGSALGLYYYLRVMITMYMVEGGQIQKREKNVHWTLRAGTIVLLSLALLVLFTGVYPQPLLEVVQHAGMPVALTN